jgi:hypothetical protein
MPSRTVRIDDAAHELLKQLAKQAGLSMQEVLTLAIEEHRRQVFLKTLHNDFTRLRSNQKAWTEELDERALWDSALCDGQEE